MGEIHKIRQAKMKQTWGKKGNNMKDLQRNKKNNPALFFN